MNQEKRKLFFLFLIGALAGMFGMYVFSNYKIEKKQNETAYITTKDEVRETNSSNNQKFDNQRNSAADIDELTREETVIDFVKQNGELPDYYITKSEARNLGWVPNKGNLCDVLPGRAIGGDRFSNREKQLPKGHQYYEADVNYDCGHRGADRIVYTSGGDVWLTHDHYKSFDKQ